MTSKVNKHSILVQAPEKIDDNLAWLARVIGYIDRFGSFEKAVDGEYFLGD